MNLVMHLLLTLCCLAISTEEATQVGEKVWHNECAKSLEGLTSWKPGEDFASLGIGHFIWYPIGKYEGFQETFPELLEFLGKKGVVIPVWLQMTQGCPWHSREDFYKNIHSPEMKNLRQFLFETKDLQAVFMAERLEHALPLIIQKCHPDEIDKVESLFLRLAEDAKGLYALIDYLNFKGAGISASETYNGQGWGLLQVLHHMSPSSPKPLLDFVEVAKTLLAQRVLNAPPERHEEQWLMGWHHRLDTYLDDPNL